MSKLDLSAAERRYVARVATADRRTGRRVAFHAAALGPLCAFGVYGLWRGDIVALGLAFLALVAFFVWRIAHEIASAPLYFSVFSKLAAIDASQAERSDGQLAIQPQGAKR